MAGDGHGDRSCFLFNPPAYSSKQREDATDQADRHMPTGEQTSRLPRPPPVRKQGAGLETRHTVQELRSADSGRSELQ
jgi:hypothetical protein